MTYQKDNTTHNEMSSIEYVNGVIYDTSNGLIGEIINRYPVITEDENGNVYETEAIEVIVNRWYVNGLNQATIIDFEYQIWDGDYTAPLTNMCEIEYSFGLTTPIVAYDHLPEITNEIEF